MSLLAKVSKQIEEELPPEEPIIPEQIKIEIINEVKVFLYSKFNNSVEFSDKDPEAALAGLAKNTFFIQYDKELTHLSAFIDNVKNKLNPETVVFFECDFILGTDNDEEVYIMKLDLDFL